MSFVNLNNRNQVLNLPATTVANLTIQDISNGIITSSNGVISSIPGIDTSNLSDSLQSRLNSIETNQTSIGISDISGLQSTISKIDSSLNALSNAGSSSIGINDVTGLSTKLSLVDSLLSENSTNVSNFASSWSQLTNSPQDNGVGIACSGNGQYIMKLGWGASSYLSNDYGNTWYVVSDLGDYLFASMSTNGQYMIAGGVRFSSDYGNTWSSVPVGSVQDCKVSSTGQFIALASNSGIYYSSNYGQSYTNWTDAGTNSWTSVTMSLDGSTAIAVRATTTPTIWKSTNYGASWSQIYNNPSQVSFGTISCSSDAKYILVALPQNVTGSIYFSNDFGASFSALGGGLSPDEYYKVAVSSSGINMLTICNSGYVYSSSNYGETWTQTNLSSSNYYGLAMSNNGSLAYVYAPGTKLFTFNSNVVSLPTAQITTPGQGSVYFDQSTNKLYVYNTSSSSWKSVTLA
jgi:photosystem II stability/assembly factor-like uncharacterized protein